VPSACRKTITSSNAASGPCAENSTLLFAPRQNVSLGIRFYFDLSDALVIDSNYPTGLVVNYPSVCFIRLPVEIKI